MKSYGTDSIRNRANYQNYDGNNDHHRNHNNDDRTTNHKNHNTLFATIIRPRIFTQ